jgi:hypothetical protein
VKPWNEFMMEDPELAGIGKKLLFPVRSQIGMAFLATLRKDGAPRLHPVSLVYYHARLFVFIPPTSPKCSDLDRDGRYALQAYPPQINTKYEEFYIEMRAKWIQEATIRQALMPIQKSV